MSLRDRLTQRQLPSTRVSLRIDFSPEADAAEDALRNALLELQIAEAGRLGVEEAQAKVDAAQAVVDEGYEHMVVNALPPADMDALIAAHPPTAEQKQRDQSVVWNEDTFRPAVLAACVEGDTTETDWRELIEKGAVTLGEVRALVNAAMLANDRSIDVRVGKG